MRLMDVVTAYLYGTLDSDVYMKIPEGYKMPVANSNKPRSVDAKPKDHQRSRNPNTQIEIKI